MTLPPPPDPHDPPERLLETARRLREKCEEQQAVLDRVKEMLALWRQDKRMKLMGEILLGDIARFEKEEAERTAQGARKAQR